MNSKFIVFILKVNIDGVDRYLADLQGTLSLSKTDAVLFKSRDRAYEFSKGIEGFYEETGVGFLGCFKLHSSYDLEIDSNFSWYISINSWSDIFDKSKEFNLSITKSCITISLFIIYYLPSN